MSWRATTTWKLDSDYECINLGQNLMFFCQSKECDKTDQVYDASRVGLEQCNTLKLNLANLLAMLKISQQD